MNIRRDEPEIREMKELLDIPEPDWVQRQMEDLYAALPAQKQAPAAPRRAKKAARTLLLAAALACCFTLTTLAAGGELGHMMEGLIGFFHGEGSESQPTTYQPIADKLEAHSLAVGQEKTENGLTVRVDEISVDHNFINVFATFMGEEPFATDENLPGRLSGAVSTLFSVSIDGKDVDPSVYSADMTQGYFVDERTYKTGQRFVCTEPLPDTFTLNLLSTRYGDEESEHLGEMMGVTGQWDFAIPVDISDLTERSIPAQEIALSTGKLQLQRFSASALGTAASFGQPLTTTGSGPLPDTISTAEGYLLIGQVALRDDKGNYLYQVPTQGYSMGGDYAAEFTGLAEDAQSVTFLPMRWAEESGENKIAPLAAGQKLETNSLSGYTIENFENSENALTLTLKPWGPAPTPIGAMLELSPCDASGRQLDLPRCLMESTVDRATGLVTWSLTYYQPFAGFDQISQLSCYNGGALSLDEEGAVTLPLE